jgi:hypothetical protein
MRGLLYWSHVHQRGCSVADVPWVPCPNIALNPKGSTADRVTKKESKKESKKEKAAAAAAAAAAPAEPPLPIPLKDCDLDRSFHVGSDKERLLEQVQKDCQFLRERNLMDYSMLVAIANCTAVQSSSPSTTPAVDQSTSSSSSSSSAANGAVAASISDSAVARRGM